VTTTPVGEQKMQDEGLKSRWESTFVPNYATPSLELVKGQGARVWDAQGREYLDLLAGIATNVLGHAHPAIVDAVSEQVARLGHVSNLYASDVGLQYAQRLSQVAGGRRVLLVNSGAEANEAAWKLVRRHAHATGRGDGVVVAFDGSFHGRTVATLGLTGQPAHREGFDPLPGGVVHVPYDDPGALEAAFEKHDVAGVFAEYVQGEGGVTPMSSEMAKALGSLTQSDDTLLVADEVQTGVARTGSFFAHEHYGHSPDVVTMAKGIGGGLPLGAMLTKSEHASLLGPGSHGCTYGGNPIAVAAGRVVLEAVEQEGLAERARVLGERFSSALDERLQGAGLSTRGLGLLQGVPLPDPVAPAAVKAAQQAGVLMGQAGKGVVRVAPPLIIEEADLMDAVPTVAEAIESALS
jgi:acetylornithine/N-succinyldiaminopimelate aminotransferase